MRADGPFGWFGGLLIGSFLAGIVAAPIAILLSVVNTDHIPGDADEQGFRLPLKACLKPVGGIWATTLIYLTAHFMFTDNYDHLVPTLVVGALLMVAILLFSTQKCVFLSAEGIRGTNNANMPIFMDWRDPVSASQIDFMMMKWIDLVAVKSSQMIRIPRAVVERNDFQDAVHRLCTPDHPLKIEQAIRSADSNGG